VVTELDCPGYVIDDAQRIIQLKPNETAQFVFTNSKKPSLYLLKTSSDGSPMEGVSFRLAKIEDGTHYLDKTTSASGEILWEGLEPGVYSLVETATLNDHILSTKEHHVELFPGRTSTIVLENHKRPNLYVYKNDADDGSPIEHTIFTVRAADGHSVDEIETGPDGLAVLENLLPGVYEISEKSVPSPWLKDAPSQLVTLYPDRDRTVYFENHKRPVIEIIKENEVTFERLANVPFQVWYASNNTSTGELNDLGIFYTDENGRIELDGTKMGEFGLRDGWFRVKELEPLKGFAKADPDTQEAFVAAGQGHTFVFRNRPLSAICVWKYDSVHPNVAIEGAVFQVKYLSGNTSGTGGTVIGTFQTSKNGSFTATGLKKGTYIVEELSSDGGHVIDTPPQTVYLSGEEQEVIHVRFGNSAMGSLLVKKVSDSDGAPLIALLRRPQVGYEDLRPFDPDRPDLPAEVAEQVEISVKYEGYIQRQLQEVEELHRMESRALPPETDYAAIQGLRLEAREKLNAVRPLNLGQAARISGVSPADVAALMIWLER
jgi:uncharacterized surface anchored protein